MNLQEIEKTVKKEVSFKLTSGDKKVEAWRKRGGYIVRWTGFEIGKVAPRNEMQTEPFFEETTSEEIQKQFELLCCNEQ